jgi:tetratricopeptide (TPR) repeat protein
MRRAALPAGHPDIATGLDNIAGCLSDLGRHEEALERAQEALAMHRVSLPAGHSDIATSLDNIARLLRALGRYEEALARAQEAAARHDRV